MPMQLHIETPGGYLHAYVSGDFEVAQTLRIQHQVFAAAGAAELVAILIDAREVRGEPAVMHRYKLALSVAELARGLTQRLGRPVRIAFLGNEPVISQDHFGEDVAVNRGANMRVFTAEEEALAWVRAS